MVSKSSVERFGLFLKYRRETTYRKLRKKNQRSFYNYFFRSTSPHRFDNLFKTFPPKKFYNFAFRNHKKKNFFWQGKKIFSLIIGIMNMILHGIEFYNIYPQKHPLENIREIEKKTAMILFLPTPLLEEVKEKKYSQILI